MFDRIGSKIKGLASFVTGVGIIASVVVGFFILCSGGDLAPIGILIAIGGSLFSWIGSLFLYGFGELIEKTCIIEERLSLHPQMKASDERYGNSGDEQMKTGERIVASQKDLDEMLKKGIITEEEYREATKRG